MEQIAQQIIDQFQSLAEQRGFTPIRPGLVDGGQGKAAGAGQPLSPLETVKPPLDISSREIDRILLNLDPGMHHDDWVTVGMALHHQFQGSDKGLALWDNWSKVDPIKYSRGECRKRWSSFSAASPTRRPTTFATLKKWAADHTHPMPPLKLAAAGISLPRPAPDLDAVFSTVEELQSAALHPRVIAEHLFFADVIGIAGGGGSGKTTQVLYELAHLAAGKTLYDRHPTTRPDGTGGKVLLITKEDSRAVCQARLWRLLLHNGFSQAEIALVAQNLGIWDVTGSGGANRLVRTDGDIETTDLVDRIVEATASYHDQLDMIVFDPLVSFGANEDRANDNAQALIEAARSLVKQLNCCVQYVHHTGKQQYRDANDGSVDQYIFRGGSALVDGMRGARAVLPLQGAINAADLGIEPLHPASESSWAEIRHLKNTYSRIGEDRLLIERCGWALDFHWTEQIPEDARMQAEKEAVVKWLADHAHIECSRNGMEERKAHEQEMSPAMSRNRFRQVLRLLIDEGQVEEGGEGDKRRKILRLKS